MKLITSYLFVFCFAFAAGLAAAAPRPASKDKTPAKSSIPLLQYLDSTSQRLGCYYTTEIVATGTEPVHIDKDTIVDDPKVNTIAQLLLKLHRNFPSMTTVQDQRNSKIIHLIDVPLTTASDYPLSHNGSVVYSGSLAWMPDSLGTQSNVKIKAKHSFVETFIFIDYATKITITVHDQEIRSILTDCVPLTKYSHYLWSAETYQIDGQSVAYVYYHGPMSQATPPEKPTIVPPMPIKPIKL